MKNSIGGTLKKFAKSTKKHKIGITIELKKIQFVNGYHSCFWTPRYEFKSWLVCCLKFIWKIELSQIKLVVL